MNAGDLLSTLSVAVCAISVAGHLPAAFVEKPRRREIALGLTLGLGAVGSMLTPVQILPGLMFDLRAPLVAAASFVGGPLAGCLAALLPLALRLQLGGVGTIAGVAVIAAAALSGACVRHLQVRPGLAAAAVGILVSASGVLSGALLPAPARDSLLGHMSWSVLCLQAGTTWLGILCLRRDDHLRDLVRRNMIYGAIIEALPDSLNAKDLNSRFLTANPATARLMQVASSVTLIGRTDADFYDAEMADGFRHEEGRVLAGETLGPLLQNVALPDGSWCWLETMKTPLRERSGRVCGIITHNRDVTERQRLRLALDRIQSHLQAAISNMADGVVLFDAGGTILFCNDQYRTLFARTADLRVPGGRFEDILRASVLRGEEEPKTDLDAWIAERRAGLLLSGERLLSLSDGRSVQVRSCVIGSGEVLLTFSDITALKRSEAEAREANKLLLSAEQIANVGHWRYDVISKSVYWSEGTFRIHGLPPAERAPALAEAISRYHPDDRGVVESCLAEAIGSNQPFEFALRIVRPNGAIRHVISRGSCESDAASGEVKALFGVLLDVTDLTVVQRDLVERTADLEATLAAMDQGLVHIGGDGVIRQSNARFAELLAVPAPLLGCEQPRRFAAVEALLATRGDRVEDRGGRDERGTRAFEVIRADGHMLEGRSVMLDGGAQLVTYTDVTMLRQSERAVVESEARYRLLADTTSDVITRLDLDLVCRYVSPACRTLLGYEPEELVDRSVLAPVHPEDGPALRQRIEALTTRNSHGDRVTAVYRAAHKDGRWIWVELVITLVRQASAEVSATLIGSLRDITERQRVALELEQARTAAENLSRLKSEFVANMSHELRTPLTGILGLHDLLERDPALGVEQRRHVVRAREAGRALLGIVNDVLDLSRMEAGEMRIEAIPFDLAALVDGCRDLVQPEADLKALQLTAEVVGASGLLVGDPTRLRQVLINLVNNALKFTPAGGVAIRATYRRDSGQLRVEVADEGVGIADDHLPLLFRRFSQADASITRRFGGSGLGLAISQRLVNLMKGEIGVASTVGVGSTFWFELPLPVVDHRVTVAEDALVCDKPRNTHVLLAEDNVLNQEIIAAMLGQRGLSVTVVDNGMRAVEVLRAGGNPAIDVVLMDLQMPVMDGLSATMAIRAEEAADRHRTAVPIIGLTANVMEADAERCLEAGMQAHVAKPVEWPHLFSAIEHVRSRPGGTMAVDRGRAA